MPFAGLTPRFGGVGLSLNQKKTLYRELGQLLRSGKPLPAALEILAGSSSGSLRSFQKKLQKSLVAGDSVSEAFAKQRPAIGEMEVSMLSAGGRSGRLMESCLALSSYFQSLAKARSAILQKCAYPLFIFHFGVLTLGAKTMVVEGVPAYLKETLTTLGLGYCFAAVPLALLWYLLILARSSSLVDQLLSAIPGTGTIRSSFALARFCATYDAQLNAGVNVLESLQTAAESSQSAVIIRRIAREMPALRSGSQVGEVLAKTKVFPEWLVRAFRVAEETGGLDKELPQMAVELEAKALSRVETLSEWIPRLIYMAIMLFMGWKTVALYQGYADQVGKALEF